MLTRLLREEEGQTLVEYGLLVSLLGLVCIAILTVLGRKLRDVFITVNTNINSGGGTAPPTLPPPPPPAVTARRGDSRGAGSCRAMVAAPAEGVESVVAAPVRVQGRDDDDRGAIRCWSPEQSEPTQTSASG